MFTTTVGLARAFGMSLKVTKLWHVGLAGNLLCMKTIWSGWQRCRWDVPQSVFMSVSICNHFYNQSGYPIDARVIPAHIFP